MSIETISFLLGAGLIVVAVIGGGIEIRELKIPPIGTAARAASLLFGVVFVGLTFYLRQPASPPASAASSTTAGSERGPGTPSEAPATAPSPQTTSRASDVPREPPAEAVAAKQTFTDPLLGGVRLDVCYTFSERCGEEAATAWCQAKGFDRAATSSGENVGKRGIATRMIGNGAECHADYCAAFSRIECERS